MPKIIPDINARIEKAAISLFNTYDFGKVDMKMIASECKIAVGTLYNYYPNKQQLFIHALHMCWAETAHELDVIYETYSCPEEKLSHSIEVLYDHLAARKGMGKYIYKIIANFEVEAEVKALFEIIFSKVERIFEDFEKKSFFCETELMNTRLAKSLIIVIQNAMISYPLEREDNLHYIQDFFYNSMHVDLTMKKNYIKTHPIL